MPQSQRSLINAATTDLLSVVGTGVPAASLHEMMKALDQNHGETLTIDTACSSLVDLSLMALQLHSKLKLVREAAINGNVSSGAGDDGETFHRGRVTYYKRELDEKDWTLILGLPWVNWQKALILKWQETGNNLLTAKDIQSIAESLYTGSCFYVPSVSSLCNPVFVKKGLPYRILSTNYLKRSTRRGEAKTRFEYRIYFQKDQ